MMDLQSGSAGASPSQAHSVLAFFHALLRRPFPILPLILAVACFAPRGELRAEEEWSQLANTPKVTVWYRGRPGTEVKEYKAVGIIAAPSWVVDRVLDDSEAYPQFMPHIAECRVLQRSQEGNLVYQRVSGPLVSDRDHVIRVRVDKRPSKSGPVYFREWKCVADSSVPERPRTVRLKFVEGSWTLAPEGEKTRATYIAFADPGGAIPASILKYLNKSTIPQIFEAVAKRSADPKYRKNPPAP